MNKICDIHKRSSCNCKAHSYDFNVPEDARQRIDFLCCDGKQTDDANNHNDQQHLNQLIEKINDGKIFVDQFIIRSLNPELIFQHDSLEINWLEISNIDMNSYQFASQHKNLYIHQLVISNVRMYRQLLYFIQSSWNHLEMIHLDSYQLIDDDRLQPPYHFLIFNQPFEVYSKLKTLNMIRCNIKSLAGVDLLKNVANLRMLSLAHNQLTSIDNVNFFPADSKEFRSLDLSYNQLRWLPANWKLPSSLTHLHLDNNEITIFPNNVYHLNNLREFWFQQNRQSCENVKRIFQKKIPEIFICWTDKIVTMNKTNNIVEYIARFHRD
ncbi:hypothetical protein HUG17_8037 [Dermatophagoides farinae]|uniref:Uncharacterized protein n=1 Tax=Dermatophagoides farinae TaxID=6954 RepID=A0A9D4SGA9_DERFA|nr:hypothetical protein HUG17_8037 [Dermatophagoides farinae]